MVSIVVRACHPVNLTQSVDFAACDRGFPRRLEGFFEIHGVHVPEKAATRADLVNSAIAAVFFAFFSPNRL